MANGKKVPGDAIDISELWLDPALGDGLTEIHRHHVPVGKPKDFFRTVPDPAYRRLVEIYTHKPEGQIEEQSYIIAKSMQGAIPEARRCTLITVVHRDNSIRLWPLKLPNEGERDNEAWATARAAAKEGMDSWVKVVWLRSAYQTRVAQRGYAPDPDWSKLPPFDELVRLAFGEHGMIHDHDHRIVRDLFGAASTPTDDDDLS
jgi:hypothetical protein